MTILCMDKNWISVMCEKAIFLSYEEVNGVLYPLFLCDDMEFAKTCIDSGSCVQYDIMTF